MKPRAEKVIHDIFGAEKEVFLRLPHKSKFFRDTENHPSLDEYGVYHYVEEIELDMSDPSDSTRHHSDSTGVVSPERNANETLDTKVRDLNYTENTENTENTESRPNRKHRQSNQETESEATLQPLVEIVDLNLEEALGTKKTYSLRQYENMDLVDSFVKGEVFRFAEQFSFLKVFGLLDVSTGETFIFQDDDDFYKVKSLPMNILRDGGTYELIVCDKRFVLQQDTPAEIRSAFQEDFDRILFCDFDLNRIRDFMEMVRLKRESKGTDMAFIESMKRSEGSLEEKGFSPREREEAPPTSTAALDSLMESPINDTLKDKKLLQKNNTNDYRLSPLTYTELENEGRSRVSKRRIPKYRVIGVEQVERYYSQFLYTELIAMRDLIESKMERNPSIDTQLELQFEIQVEEAIKKRDKHIALFMEMDLNYSGYVTWEEYSNAKTEHYIQNHTKKVQEKYFNL